MLVLTRRQQESIVIGENGEVKITVLRVNGNQVKIGIEAPRDLAINREEIFLRIKDKEHADVVQEDREVA